MLISEDQLRDCLSQTAVSLMAESSKISFELTELVCARVPQATRPDLRELISEVFRSSTVPMLDCLARDVPTTSIEPTIEQIDTFRAIAQMGLSLTTVLRAFRGDHQYIVERWSDAVTTQCRDPKLAVEAIKAGSSYLLSWIDAMAEQIMEEYQVETERLARDRTRAHLEDTRRVLSDDQLDIDSASKRLRYRLNTRHVAMVLRDRPESTRAARALDATAREIARAVADGQGLVLRVDSRTMWCWFPWDGRPLRCIPKPKAPVLVAVGRPGDGLDGFRRSHREALDALHVAELTSRPVHGVTYYDDVDIVSVFSTDPKRCREFMLQELGPLAADDLMTLRQRETLRAFYAANSNYRATASALGLHHNTVRYRLERVERALGRTLDQRRLALELALHLEENLGIPNQLEK